MTNKNILIVGQGLAGTLLSFELGARNISHTIMANDKLTKSSTIAAGIYNPVVFKRLTKSWLIDDLLPTMNESYSTLESMLGIQLLHKKNIAKLIHTSEKEWWLQQIEKKGLEAYFNGFHSSKQYQSIKSEFEIAEITQSGHLDINSLLSHYKDYFKTKSQYIDQSADYESITIKGASATINNELYDQIIFCDGANTVNNPFSPKNTFYLSKGDIIEVEIEQLDNDCIINKDVFIMPKGNKRFIIGSTYQHHPFNPEPDPKDGELLIQKASKIINSSIKLISHYAGVRPTVKDRRPILGLHPEHSQIAFFNGLGTKGVMLAPYFAKQMANLIENNTAIPNPEVNVQRFFK